ncbi:TolC family protein [Breznakiella homolactica]|uniref:TolC family protein n=1 Tax=Breznakiella homolactica TaxID=2798577 RepID=A0A7T7XPJ5_9SPIR|nr:TolC family protein [Breznakiella homolactica]QQO10121.1 TolC family protein [Breznakiella homolactica]
MKKKKSFGKKAVFCAVFSVLLCSMNLSGQTAADEVSLWDRESLLQAALRGNTGILSAESKSRAAQSLHSAAKASRLPDIRLMSNLSYMTNPQTFTIDQGSIFPGGTIPVTIPSLPGTTIPIDIPALPLEDFKIRLTENTYYEFGVTLEQPVFTWGRISNSIKAAELGSRAALIQVEYERRSLETMLDVYLYGLAYLREMQAILGEQRICADRLIHISEESYAGGFLLRTDLLEARMLAAEVTLGEYSLLENQGRNFLALKTLAGLPGLDLSGVRLPEAAAVRESLGYTREHKDELLSRIHAQNPGLRLLSLQTQAHEKKLAAAKGQFYGKPELGVFLQLSYAGPRFPFIEDDWRKDNNGNFTATLGIRSLLFDGGSIYHSIAGTEEELIQARLEEEKGWRDMEEFLDRTLLQLEVSKRKQEYLELKMHAALSKKEQAENEWNAGYGGEREVLIQELDWYAQRVALLQEELSALYLALQLENVLGG